MTVTHEPWLVALSLIMAFQGSFVGLSLAVQVRGARDPRRRHLLAGAALTLALAIWSMHFVGILAAKFHITVDYLVLPTLLSFLVCVLVVGIAVFAASNKRLTSLRLGLSAFVMGAGICTMHYLGMYALHTSLHIAHDPAYVLASFLIAFNAAGLALWLLFSSGRRPPIVVSAAVMGLAISAMHYTAMTGMTFDPAQSAASLIAPSLGPGALAILVSCVAFLVSALFLLTLVPSQANDKTDTEGAEASAAPAPPLSQKVPNRKKHPQARLIILRTCSPKRHPVCKPQQKRSAIPTAVSASLFRLSWMAAKPRLTPRRSSPFMLMHTTPGCMTAAVSISVPCLSAKLNSNSIRKFSTGFTAATSST